MTKKSRELSLNDTLFIQIYDLVALMCYRNMTVFLRECFFTVNPDQKKILLITVNATRNNLKLSAVNCH